MDEKTYWFRVEARSVGDINYDGDLVGSHMEVTLRKFEVLKTTPKGVWLKQFMEDKKFVLRDARKRFACPTVAEAFESFRARKARQKRIYKARIADVEDALYRASILEGQIERGIVRVLEIA